MQNFEYMAPGDVSYAAKALGAQWGLADVLAGGTDQLSLMKERIHTPTRLVSLRKIAELRGIALKGRELRIGAMVKVADLYGDKHVSGRYQALLQAADGISSPQMRAMGTVGGDLLQRPRCWYFRNGFGLLAQGADGKSAVPNGENRYHAILGNKGPAYFVNPSSFAPALIAYGARVTLVSPEGRRTIALEELYQTPTKDGERETAIKPNEILVEIILPSARLYKSATYEVRQRTLMDWPLATASVAVRMDGSTVKEARIVMGHVAPTPWRAAEAENLLAGKKLDESSAAEAGKAAVSAATPLSQNKYKVRLAEVAVKRALLRVAGKEV